MKLKLHHIFNLLFLCLIFASCRDHNFNVDDKLSQLNKNEKSFAKDFEDFYGEYSKENTWQTANTGKIGIDLSELPNTAYDILVFTSNPKGKTKNCYLLTEKKGVSGNTTLDFDYPAGINAVFVSAMAGDGTFYTEKLSLNNSTQPETITFKTSTIAENIGEYSPMVYSICIEAYINDKLDFDYNDVVLEVEYVRGRPNAEVTLVAVGNDCNTRILYRISGTNSKKEEETLFEEAHAALGYPAIYSYATDKNEYLILNTGINETGRTAHTTLDLKTDIGASIVTIAPKFIIGIMADDKDEKTLKEYNIAHMKNMAATGLLIAAPHWNYLPEGMSIDVLYYKFAYWIADPSTYKLWFTTMFN